MSNGCCCGVSTGRVEGSCDCPPALEPTYGCITLPEGLDEDGNPDPIVLPLPADAWVVVPLTIIGPTSNLIVAAPGMVIPAGFAGDYDMEWGLALSIIAQQSNPDAIQGVIADAGPTVIPLWPTMDWHDVQTDPGQQNDPMFGLQGNTLHTWAAPSRVALLLRSLGGASVVNVYTANLEAVRIG